MNTTDINLKSDEMEKGLEIDMKSDKKSFLKVFELEEIFRLSVEVEKKQNELRRRFFNFLEAWADATKKELMNVSLERVKICEIQIEGEMFIYYLMRGDWNVYKLRDDEWLYEDYDCEVKVTSKRMNILRMKKFIRNLPNGLRQYIEELKKENEDFDKVNELLKRFE